MLTVIKSKLHFLQIKGKLFLRYAVKFHQALFGITPKAFQAVNINLTAGKAFAMINTHMPIAAKHQGIITLKSVGVNKRTSPNSLNRHMQKRAGGNILDRFDLDHTVSLINAKYRHFRSCSTTAFAFASAAKIRFIKLYFTGEKLLTALGCCQDSIADYVEGLQSRRVTDPALGSSPVGGDLQLEEFDEPKPCFKRAIKLIYPPSAKIVKGIATWLASVSFSDDSIYFSAVASCAKNTPVFPALFSKVQPSFIFGSNNVFKAVYVHLTPL